MTLLSQTVIVKENGRVNLPAALRRALNIHTGDRLIFNVQEGGQVELVTAATTASRGRGLYAHLNTQGSIVDELIAERHAEAERE